MSDTLAARNESGGEEHNVWARVAGFEGDPADVEARLERLRPMIDSGAIPPELADARFLLLVDRASGGMLGVTLFESE